MDQFVEILMLPYTSLAFISDTAKSLKRKEMMKCLAFEEYDN